MQPLIAGAGADRHLVLRAGQQGIAEVQAAQHQLGEGDIFRTNQTLFGDLGAAEVRRVAGDGGYRLQHRVHPAGQGPLRPDGQLVGLGQGDGRPGPDIAEGSAPPAVHHGQIDHQGSVLPGEDQQAVIQLACQKLPAVFLVVLIEGTVPGHRGPPLFA